MRKLFPLLMVLLLSLSMVSAIEVLSADKIQFDSNNPAYSGPAFRVVGIEYYGSESTIFSLNDLSKANTGAYELTGTGTINTQLSNYRITYPYNGRNLVYRAFQLTWDNGKTTKTFALPANAQEECSQMTQSAGYTNPVSIYTGPDPYFPYLGKFACVGFYEDGVYATINEGTHRFDEKITVAVNGKSSQSVMLSESDIGGNLEYSSGRNVQARILPSLGSYTSEPRPDLQYGSYYKYTRGTHAPVDAVSDNEFKNTHALNIIVNDFIGCVNAVSYWSWSGCLSQINQQQDQMIQTATPPIDYSFSASSGSVDSGQYVLLRNDGRVYKYPLISLTIDAEWVGIYRPTGDPSVGDIIAPSEVRSGDRLQLQVAVTNEAPVDASFNVKLSCSGPITFSINPSEPFRAGQVRTFTYFGSVGQIQGTQSIACTYTATDSLDASNSDSSQITISAKEQNECEVEGATLCRSDTIFKCVNLGGVLKLTQLDSCAFGCVQEGSYAYCDDNGGEVVPVCGDGIPTPLERDAESIYYCPEDIKLPDPTPGDGICDFREQKGQPFYVPGGDCDKITPPPKPFNFDMALIIGIPALLVGAALYFRIKKMGK